MKPEELESRRLIYQAIYDHHRFSMQLSGEYGKWLVASLLLIHGATIAFLAQDQRLSVDVLPHIFWWHIAGLILALFSGFIIWINWSLHAAITDLGYVNPEMIYKNDSWPNIEGAAHNKWITYTFWWAISAGIGSALTIVISSWVVYAGMV